MQTRHCLPCDLFDKAQQEDAARAAGQLEELSLNHITVLWFTAGLWMKTDPC